MAAPELKTLGRYNIERVLGKGAMGVVYEGVDPRLGRRVAIKTILKSHLDEDTGKEFAMRFVREAQAVARLNHPHIVQVYDFGEEGDIAYLVMEFIKGKELKNFFDASERFDLKEAVRIMCELCDALDFAHHAGIIHRDIKPANVMLDHQARTKLTDFGVARVQDVDKTSVERTQAGTMVGTPAYMSPEQITGGQIDRRTDVFSAGIILYQFLTGEKPFTGSGAWTIAKKIIQEEPALPSSLNNAVTPLFDAVVNRALAKNPDQRYQSARDLAVALKRALEGKRDEDDSDRTVIGAISEHMAAELRPAAAVTGDTTRGGVISGNTQAGNQEVELEFWRAIKDGNDPDDFDLYVQQFPTGIYAALAKRKIAKLRGASPEETTAKAKEQEKKEAEDAARREAQVKAKLEAEKARLEAEIDRKEEEYKKREAEARVRAQTEEKARHEAMEKAKQEAAAERERARQEAERAKEEAERAKEDALAAARLEGEKAKREAEEKAEKFKQEAAAAAQRARLEAEKARSEAEEKAREEAEKARRDAEEKARKKAELRAKKDAEERAKREAQFKKREAELKAQAAAGGKKSSPLVAIVVGIVVLAMAAIGYFFVPKEDPQAVAKLQAMQKQLEEAKQKAAELEVQKKKEEEARIALEKARKAEEDARKAGDLQRQQEFADVRLKAEAEANKQADATKLREAEAKQTAEAAEAAKKHSDPKKSEADAKKEQELIAKQRDIEAKQRELELKIKEQELLAKQREFEAKRQQEGKTQVALAPSGGDVLFQQGTGLEGEGRGTDAVKVYTQAARSGSGKAAKRLGEIYDKGLIGIPRDYAESLKWRNAARVLGEEVPTAKSR
jgi:eukaryotic-like serine/threonine-protein kinase